MIVSGHELRLAVLEARLASLERRLSALPEPTAGRTYHRSYAFDLDAPGVAEREDAWQRRLDQAWTVGEIGELTAREGEDAQGGGN